MTETGTWQNVFSFSVAVDGPYGFFCSNGASCGAQFQVQVALESDADPTRKVSNHRYGTHALWWGRGVGRKLPPEPLVSPRVNISSANRRWRVIWQKARMSRNRFRQNDSKYGASYKRWLKWRNQDRETNSRPDPQQTGARESDWPALIRRAPMPLIHGPFC